MAPCTLLHVRSGSALPDATMSAVETMTVTQIVIIAAAAVAAIALVLYLERRRLASRPVWTPSSPADAADFAAIQGTWHLASTTQRYIRGESTVRVPVRR